MVVVAAAAVVSTVPLFHLPQNDTSSSDPFGQSSSGCSSQTYLHLMYKSRPAHCQSPAPPLWLHSFVSLVGPVSAGRGG